MEELPHECSESFGGMFEEIYGKVEKNLGGSSDIFRGRLGDLREEVERTSEEVKRVSG